MNTPRPDERFALSGNELSDLEELMEDVAEAGWPDAIQGGTILALGTSDALSPGVWRVRGSLSGYAEWLCGDWRILLDCPECGSEWWDDETAPAQKCCREYDMIIRGGPPVSEEED